jgi:hypothetical protein
MKRTIPWIILGVIVLGGLLTLTDLLMPGARGMGYGSMMMTGRMWEYMFGNTFPASPIGWVAVWLTWATRLALLALLLTGLVWLMRSLGGAAPNAETPDK